MSVALFFLALVGGMSVQASESFGTLEAQLESIFCAEYDPIFVGDACVVFVVNPASGEKWGLVYSDYELMNVHFEGQTESDYIGKNVQVSRCFKFLVLEKISEFRKFDSNYSYLDCHLDGFQIDFSRAREKH